MFVLNESLMNGTTTINISNRVINAPTFEEAVQVVRGIAEKTGAKFDYDNISDTGWSYTVHQDEVPNAIVLQCRGYMARTDVRVE